MTGTTAPRSLFTRPTEDYVFIDTSALLHVFDRFSSTSMGDKGQAYSKFILELMPQWGVVGVINPLVVCELVSQLQTKALRNVLPQKNREGIRAKLLALAEKYKFYTPPWQQAHGEMLQIIMGAVDILDKAECIICEAFPGECPRFERSKAIVSRVMNAGPKSPNIPDLFHMEFMKEHGIVTAISDDGHFQNIEGLQVHRYKA